MINATRRERHDHFVPSTSKNTNDYPTGLGSIFWGAHKNKKLASDRCRSIDRPLPTRTTLVALALGSSCFSRVVGRTIS